MTRRARGRALRRARWRALWLLGAPLAACRGPAPAAQPPGAAVDSLVLERTRCFGACPAYRLGVDRAGVVTFAARSPRDSTRATARVAPATLGALVDRARRAGFFALPVRISGDPTLCPRRATDHPTVYLTIFAADTAHRVEDYHGCRTDDDAASPLVALRALEVAVDSATGSSRWVRPSPR